MSVTDWILVCLVSLISSSVGMQIHLADTGQLLHPQLESATFPFHPPKEYRVLRWSSRRRRSVSVSLHLPFPDSQVDLILNKVNLAASDLKLSFHQSPGQDVDVSVPLDCIYSGGSSTTWAVISVCSGLMGVVERGGQSYQVEEVDQHLQEEQPQELRYRRATKDSLVVIYPLRTRLAEETVLPPVVPDLEEDLEATTTVAASLNTSTASDDDLTTSHDEPTTSHEVIQTPPRRVSRVRRRIQKESSYTVEVGVFVDRALYSYVQRRYPNSKTNNKVVEIVMTLINAVHRLYSDPSLGDAKIGMLVKRVEVLGVNKPSSEKGDIYEYLKNFCKWQAKLNPQRTSRGWDHALLLSGQDLWNMVPSRNTTVGLAYVGGMCSRSYSCTVNEATSLAAAYIIAHELGHNFNMQHDGKGKASSCKKNSFIMSPVMASGATIWSSCSRDALSKFLETKGKCLRPENTRESNNDDRTHEGKSPGKRFDADEQCHYMYGKGWRHFQNSHKPFNNVCKEIWCRNGRRLKTPSAAALEGTRCGNSKVCKRGTCVRVKKTVRENNNQKTAKSGRQKTDKIKKYTKSKTEEKSQRATKRKTTKTEKRKNSQAKKSETSQLDIPRQEGKVKKKTKKKKIAVYKNNNKRKSKTLITKKDVKSSIKEKTKVKKKKPKKFRRTETPTHIIIKERMRYVEGKGWKIKIIRIKKTQRMIEEAKNKKKNKRKGNCNKNCKKDKSKSTKSKIKKKTQKNARQKSKKPIKNISKTSKITRASIKVGEHCKPQKIKYVEGKGWWVKIPIDCIRPTAVKKST